MEPTKTPRHSVSVAGVIFNDDDSQVLLIKRRDNDRWEPPGGVLELNETITDGLRREIREETGIEVEIEALTGIYKNMPRGIVALVYRCKAISPPALQTDEAKEVAWHSAHELANVMPAAYAIRIQDAHIVGAPSTRAHDGVALID